MVAQQSAERILAYSRHAAELGAEVLGELAGDVWRVRVRGEVFEVWLWCNVTAEGLEWVDEFEFQFGASVT